MQMSEKRTYISDRRSRIRRGFVSIAVLKLRTYVVVLGTIIPVLGNAEIIARSQEECLAYADVALVSRAMVSEGVPELFQLPTLLAIYQAPQSTLQEVLEASRRTKKPAKEWAVELATFCVRNQGRLSGLLGVSL